MRDAIAQPAEIDLGQALIALFAGFVILVLWTQAQPFASLSDYSVIDDPTQSNSLRRNLTLLILGLTLLLVWRGGNVGPLWAAVSPGLVAIFGWFALTSLLSSSPGLALNRLALAGVVIGIALCLPLLFKRVEIFVTTLGVATAVAILLCFLGVLFIPDLAIHSLRDTAEQGLAGDWRGMFRHKNDLASMAIHFSFTGLLLWRLGRPAWGGMILTGALVLLIMSGGKSAALLLVPALIGAALIVRANHPAVIAALAVGGLALVTVGSVAFPALAAITNHLPDPTFTGRADIWQLALDAAGRRPLTGYGYNVFWDTGVIYAVAGSNDTAAQVSHAHNGFLDIAISAGVPGLLLVLGWAAIAPLRHIATIRRRALDRAEQALLEFFVQGWLFTLLISSLEAVLFNRGDSIWFTGLLSIVCLRLWSRADLAR
ncbi:O-antigen polymerase [Devosia sp. LC5]|uniref:O-antigen ligase family protein n=1 Tax=Devosia sp. LC5 TaxID=1502724 RepID=UPI0004E44F92|nr:O-antigen ligase family protein [Devosia sp. LC5]KFC70683.1 O-antigen polymerase [Devosia sp. LC5]